MELTDHRASPAISAFFLVVVVLIAWVAAWELKLSLDIQYPTLTTDTGSFTYWLAAKLLIWVVPAVWFVKHLGLRFVDLFGFARIKRALLWGGGFGVAIVLINIVSKALFFHKPIIAERALLQMINAVIVAPAVEEIFFRGAVLKGLLTAFSFKSSNILTAMLFLLIHIPGWYFQGDLAGHFMSTQAAAILLLGLLFGYIAYRSDSLVGAMIAHSLNNLTS